MPVNLPQISIPPLQVRGAIANVRFANGKTAAYRKQESGFYM